MLVLNVRDVAQRINKSEETVKRYIRSGKFPNAFKVSDKEGWRIPESDLIQQTSSLPQQEQLTLDPPSCYATDNEIQELVILAYQAVTLTHPTEELIRMLTTVGIRRTLEILLIIKRSEKKVKNPVGFIKRAIKENWSPNTTPQKVEPRHVNFEDRNGIEPMSLPNGFPFYNWLESE